MGQLDSQPFLNHAAWAIFDVSDADQDLITTQLLHQAGSSEDRGPHYDVDLVSHFAESQSLGAA